MKKFRAYLETSVWNFLYTEDAPDKREKTKEFFQSLSTGEYEIFVSDVVFQEIDAAPVEKRRQLMEVITRCDPVVLLQDHAAVTLAREYAKAGVLSNKHYLDLLHLAIATTNRLNMIVSWNMKHIVKRKTQIFVNATNAMAGYSDLEIWTPQEMIDDED